MIRRPEAAISDPAEQMSVGHMLTFPDGADIDPASRFSVMGTPIGAAVGSALFSRAVWNRVGPMAEDLRVGEFVDWVARARSLGVREVRVPVVAMLSRSHDNNISRSRTDDRGDYLRLVLAHRARQRAAGAE